MIYEEPDIVSYADWEMLNELNSRVTKDHSYPLPDGYYKVKEKEVIYDYIIPTHSGLPESLILSLEVLDEILFEKFDFHFIEGIMWFEEKIRVKPKVKASSSTS